MSIRHFGDDRNPAGPQKSGMTGSQAQQTRIGRCRSLGLYIQKKTEQSPADPGVGLIACLEMIQKCADPVKLRKLSEDAP